MYVESESGTGKSHIIDRVKLLLSKMEKRNRLQLAAATEVVADNINEVTMYSCLELEVKTKSGKRRFMKWKKEWKKKDILIIDEVSIVSLKMLYEIKHYCKVVKEDESPFGGICVVLLCRDFYQMPLVH